MEFLDSDDKLLKDFKGNVAARDIVQVKKNYIF